jgi:hypothetical protein
MNDIDRIDARIAELRVELDRLEIARSVLSELHAAAPTPSHKGTANGAAFTIRRVAAPAAAPAAKAAVAKAEPSRPFDAKKRAANSAGKAKVRDKIMAEIAQGPVNSGELCKKFRLVTKEQKQWLYQVFYDLKKAGVVNRTGNGDYTMIAAPPMGTPPAVESAATH